MDNNVIDFPVSIVGVGGAGKNMINDLEQSSILGSANFQLIDGFAPDILGTHWFSTSKSMIICGGLGGKTGTQEIVNLTKAAKQAGKKVIACIALPFLFEGITRNNKANDALQILQPLVDQMIMMKNEELFLEFDQTQPIYNLFKERNKIITQHLESLFVKQVPMNDTIRG